ncbi:hypothetical protein I7I48_03762 [Histoplasma ohiense]|nr:hypothetical protein I7I48_03762 [Histoplasma ohiense (nom. inval.)]
MLQTSDTSPHYIFLQLIELWQFIFGGFREFKSADSFDGIEENEIDELGWTNHSVMVFWRGNSVSFLIR